eukprot:356718-Chlamydomonas_euryale.AAC.3
MGQTAWDTPLWTDAFGRSGLGASGLGKERSSSAAPVPNMWNHAPHIHTWGGPWEGALFLRSSRT